MFINPAADIASQRWRSPLCPLHAGALPKDSQNIILTGESAEHVADVVEVWDKRSTQSARFVAKMIATR